MLKKKMKIVADENIPFVNELFGYFGEISTLAGRAIKSDDLVDADILLVRSVTQVTRNLLQGTNLKFVGTCTIGTDHLDTHYLDEKGIAFASAPGCNANSVVQYVLAALAENDFLINTKTVGIVGCGNVGSRLYRSLRALGFRCVVYDPFLNPENTSDLCEWRQLFDCDILCLHAPLTRSGPFPTYHMFNEHELSKLKPNCFFLNAGRGAVVDNAALLRRLQKQHDMFAVLDVWENEPSINLNLLEKISLGTPHIAGYSYEGRTNGALMIFQALGKFFKVDETEMTRVYNAVVKSAYGEPEELSGSGVQDIILNTYRPSADFKVMQQKKNSMSESFDLMRKNYPKRREFSHYIVSKAVAPVSFPVLSSLGFHAGG